MLRERTLQTGLDLRRVGGRRAENDLHAGRKLRGRLEQVEDPLLVRDASDEEHIRLAHAPARQHVLRLGATEQVGVDAVVDDDHPVGIDAEVGQDVLAHLAETAMTRSAASTAVFSIQLESR